MKLISFNFILFLSLHISNATAQVNTEWMRDENVEKIFTNKFKLDFGYETSKDEIFDILFTASSNFYIQNNLHAFLVMNYQNGFISNSDGKDIILNRGFGHLRFTKSIISNLDIEFFFQAGFNDFILIKDRKLFGSGLRKNIVQKETIKSFLGIGFMQEKEIYDLKQNFEQLLLRQTSYSTILYQISEDIYLNNILYFQPSIKDINDFRLLLENELQFKINKAFRINVNMNYRFDNDPHGDSKKSYFQINNGFEFDF